MIDKVLLIELFRVRRNSILAKNLHSYKEINIKIHSIFSY
jgi:hypothetical protein